MSYRETRDVVPQEVLPQCSPSEAKGRQDGSSSFFVRPAPSLVGPSQYREFISRKFGYQNGHAEK